MDVRLEKLKALGCDVDQALDRFMGDEQLYLICFEEMLADENLGKLAAALENADYENAFHYAHKLKGVYSNMGITQAYNYCADMTEKLRSGSKDKALLETCKRTAELVERLKTV